MHNISGRCQYVRDTSTENDNFLALSLHFILNNILSIPLCSSILRNQGSRVDHETKIQIPQIFCIFINFLAMP